MCKTVFILRDIVRNEVLDRRDCRNAKSATHLCSEACTLTVSVIWLLYRLHTRMSFGFGALSSGILL